MVARALYCSGARGVCLSSLRPGKCERVHRTTSIILHLDTRRVQQ